MLKRSNLGLAAPALALFLLTGCVQNPTAAPTVTLTAAATIAPGDSERRLTVDGMDRSYLLHIPADLSGDQPIPLVLVFHGFSGTGDSMAITTGFNALADAYGFLVVYPNGTGPVGGGSWNAEGCCGFADSNDVDETTFVRMIISDLRVEAAIDPKRIYATGFSNGGMLAYRLGCDLSGTLAAVAPVAGVLLNNPCQPAQPVSILHIHGMADRSVLFGFSATPAAGGFESVQQSISTWAALDGCPTAPIADRNGIVFHSVYAPCKNGTAVELYGLQGIGHTWPPDSILPASRIIWDFFVAHPKP